MPLKKMATSSPQKATIISDISQLKDLFNLKPSKQPTYLEVSLDPDGRHSRFFRLLLKYHPLEILDIGGDEYDGGHNCGLEYGLNYAHRLVRDLPNLKELRLSPDSNGYPLDKLAGVLAKGGYRLETLCITDVDTDDTLTIMQALASPDCTLRELRYYHNPRRSPYQDDVRDFFVYVAAASNLTHITICNMWQEDWYDEQSNRDMMRPLLECKSLAYVDLEDFDTSKYGDAMEPGRDGHYERKLERAHRRNRYLSDEDTLQELATQDLARRIRNVLRTNRK